MFWLSLIVFEDLISVELASWWTAAVGFILRPRPRFQSAHLKSDKPKATASQSSWPIVGIFCHVVLEEIHFMFSKKSTSCCRRNPSPGKQIVASFQPCSLFNVWWALNSRPRRNKTEFAALFPSRQLFNSLSSREWICLFYFLCYCLPFLPTWQGNRRGHRGKATIIRCNWFLNHFAVAPPKTASSLLFIIIR